MHRELLLRAARGDREALSRLIELDQASLYQFLRRRLGDSDAQDASQEVIRRMISGLISLRDPGAYRGWLFGIALRVVKERSRSLTRARRLAQEVFERRKGEAMDHPERAEVYARVHSALEELEDDLRTTVFLRYEQGLSYEEISEATGRPVGTVSKRLHTAHRKLLGILSASGAAIAMGAVTEALGSASAVSIPARLGTVLRELAQGASPPRPATSQPAGAKVFAIRPVAVGSPLVLAVLIAIVGATRVSTTDAAPRSESPVMRGPTELLTAEAPPSPAREPILFALPAQDPSIAVLVGVVRDRETKLPVPGARVWVEYSPPSSSPSAVADQAGAYRLPVRVQKGFEEVLYTVDAVAGEYVRRRTVWNVESARIIRSEDGRSSTLVRDEDDLGKVILKVGTIPLPPIELTRGSRIRGLVVDPAGRPLVGVRVTAEYQEVPSDLAESGVGPVGFPPLPDGLTDTTESDFRGAFTIPNLYPKGRCLLALAQKGYATLRSSVAVTASPEEHTFSLSPGLSIKGQITNAQGHPLAGARLFALAPAAGRITPGATTSKDGTFSFADLSGDTKVLVACLSGYGISSLELTGKDPRSITIVALESDEKMGGQVTDSDGNLLEGATAVVTGYEMVLAGRKVRFTFLDLPGGIPLPDGARGDGDGTSEGKVIEAYLPRSWAPSEAKSKTGGRFQLEKLAVRPGVDAVIAIRKDGYSSVGFTGSCGDDQNLRLRKLRP